VPKKQLSKQELYNIALKKHIKWMRSLGLNVNNDGYIIKSRIIREEEGYYPTTDLSDVQPGPVLSNHIGPGGTKQDNSWKIEESKKFTIVPAYNKGPYMVVNKKDLKTAGRKV
tara:strand:+ start:922 stop:1260 length:339 start_codon:yes stop_codon:yes gene_type:complete